MTVIASSFVFFLLLFMGVGLYSMTQKTETTEDYLVASRGMSPWTVALSAVATNNSGFMFIGLIGETYVQGLSAMWVMVGWVVGDYMMWLTKIPDQLRVRSAQQGAVTIPSFLGGTERSRSITVIAGLMTLFFLGLYAAAQLNAGSKALHALFDWPHYMGAIIGAGIVILYCFAGGIRASIWTDVMQSIVMLIAMILLCGIAINGLGGMSGLWSKLEAIDPSLIDWQSSDASGGFLLFFLGWLFAGAGVVGQPHIMIRVMTLKDAASMHTARRIYFTWNGLFAAAAIIVGLAARAYLNDQNLTDPELALPLLAQHLLPAVLVGLVLAGIFAATMSTADSQVLSCSAAITQDLFPQWKSDYGLAKLSTIFVTALVLGVALMGGSVFDLIVLAWSSLAAGLGPLLVLRALGVEVSGKVGSAMILGALTTVLIWRFVLELTPVVYDAMPAIIVGFTIFALSRLPVRSTSS